jgi:hypothetical protein
MRVIIAWILIGTPKIQVLGAMGPHVRRSVVQCETWPVCPKIILVQVNTIKHYGTLTTLLGCEYGRLYRQFH